MEELSCPRCKTTKYRNPALKLMVNVCGHALCENCVQLLFVRGSGACPECNIALRRTNFRVQLFEDANVEKEVDIRKKVLRDYNKKEEDFSTLREYNDYLEEVETIIFNLTNGIDVEETKYRMEHYKKENKDQIKKNRSKLSKDEEYLQEMIEIERQEHEFYRKQAMKEEQNQLQNKRKNKQALIDELMFSDLPADHILETHKREQQQQQEEAMEKQREKPTIFSSGITFGRQDMFSEVPTMDVGELFTYSELEYEIYGPDVPSLSELKQDGYLNHFNTATNADLAGGYEAQVGCHRYLQEAFCGLFFSVKEQSSPPVPLEVS